MFIVSKDKKAIVSTEQIRLIYTDSDKRTVKAEHQNGKGCNLGRYGSEAAAQAMIEDLANSIGRTDVSYMPDDDFVKARSKSGVQEQQKERNTGVPKSGT